MSRAHSVSKKEKQKLKMKKFMKMVREKKIFKIHMMKPSVMGLGFMK